MTGKRILTGDTPTGKLHIGHYVGTLENRVKLQNDYETFVLSADLHALSTLADDPSKIRGHVYDVLLDNLAAGLEPQKVTFFVESLVPELYELSAFLSMYVSHNRALRNPTVKDEIKMKGLGDAFSLGFVNYPIYQAADILCVKANLVPVGVDQMAHLEQARELARDMNNISGKEIFPVPEALVGRVGKLVGTDGNPKMGKSLNNTIYLSEEDDSIEEKIMGMYTDPNRIHSTDPGTVEGNPLFIYLDTFGGELERSQIEEYKEKYREGRVGDVEVKKYLSEIIKDFIKPMRERRKVYENDQKELNRIIIEGSHKARKIVAETLDEVKDGLNFIK